MPLLMVGFYRNGAVIILTGGRDLGHWVQLRNQRDSDHGKRSRPEGGLQLLLYDGSAQSG
jgi:hypothetical protein